MYEDLRGKTALVTGAGKKTGIGYAIAMKLAASGANIILADLGDNTADKQQVRTGTTGEMEGIVRELTSEFGVRSPAVNVDVSDAGSIEKMMAVAGDNFDSIDVLCNNAGASFGVPNTVQN
ncbi:MAG: SDR family NAD(P)-dependent oxidoreductase, partial [Deltaproteobacteria bacterium]|nr:SDR family NAD(P)-dependent oxidoreductase [Deltaproteobacteria bacterium]